MIQREDESLAEAIDGTIMTVAVVSSVSGAGPAASVLIILGIANLVADGFSLGIGTCQRECDSCALDRLE